MGDSLKRPTKLLITRRRVTRNLLDAGYHCGTWPVLERTGER